jgi:hypothetical protein
MRQEQERLELEVGWCPQIQSKCLTNRPDPRFLAMYWYHIVDPAKAAQLWFGFYTVRENSGPGVKLSQPELCLNLSELRTSSNCFER